MKRKDLKVTKHTRICSDHFREGDIVVDQRHKLRPDLYKKDMTKLKEDAVPIGPNVTKEMLELEAKVSARYKQREEKKVRHESLMVNANGHGHGGAC